MVLYFETVEHKTFVEFHNSAYNSYTPSEKCMILAGEYNKVFDFQQTFAFIKKENNVYETILWTGYKTNYYDGLMKVDIVSKHNITGSELIITN